MLNANDHYCAPFFSNYVTIRAFNGLEEYNVFNKVHVSAITFQLRSSALREKRYCVCEPTTREPATEWTSPGQQTPVFIMHRHCLLLCAIARPLAFQLPHPISNKTFTRWLTQRGGKASERESGGPYLYVHMYLCQSYPLTIIWGIVQLFNQSPLWSEC